jgi:hypothetical protein
VRVKVQEAEDRYPEAGGRYQEAGGGYPGGVQGRTDDSGEYKTKHIIRDVLEIVKQHTSQRDTKGKRDSDYRRGQYDPNLGSNPELPVITLLPDPYGNIDVTVEVGTQYKDPGCTAVDKNNKNITPKVDDAEVNTNNVGTYNVYCYVEDGYGDYVRAVRTVYVVDSTAPVITLVPDPEGYIELVVPVGKEYKELGAFVEDSKGNRIAEFDKLDRSFWKWKLTDEAVYEPEHVEEIATDEAGEYDVVYSYTYAQDKSVENQRRVYVVNEAAPVITLFPNPDDPDGNTYVTVEEGKSYKEPGYKAVDKDNNDITHKVKVDERVNTDTAGEYLVYYDVEDNGIAAGIMRYVYVVPSAAPEDEGIEPPPPEGRGEFRMSQPPGKTKGPRKPPSVVRWNGVPHTGPATRITPPKVPPGVISVTPQTKKKTRVYYKAKLPPIGGTVIKASPPKLPPDGISVMPGVASQSPTQPSDDKKKSDVKQMKPLR